MRAAALVIAVLMGSAYSQGPTPTSAERTHPPQERTAEPGNKAGPDQRGTKGAPIAVELMNTGKSADERQRETEAEESKATRERILNVLTGIAAVGTVLLVAVTTALAFFTWRLWDATRKLVVDAEDTVKHQLRAYVAVDNGTPRDAKGEIVVNQILLELSNDGQTPAHEVCQWTACVVREYPLQSPLDRDRNDDHRSLKTILNPGRKRGVLLEYPVDDVRAIQKDFAAGKAAVYVWGQVEYRDVFGDAHFTKFAFFQNNEGMRYHRFANYKDGNEAT